MILRYITYGLIFALAYVLGLFITPFNYYFKYWVRKYKILYPFWLFLNDTTPYDKNDIDFGDYGRFKRTPIGFYRQNAIRNSHWNLKLLLSPKKGVKTDVKGELKLLGIRWNYKVGKTKATYKIGGVKYFRVSLIKETKVFTAYRLVGKWYKFKFEKIKVKFYVHYQFGTNDYRYIYKIKIGLI